jgi:hypothetical protein
VTNPGNDQSRERLPRIGVHYGVVEFGNYWEALHVPSDVMSNAIWHIPQDRARVATVEDAISEDKAPPALGQRVGPMNRGAFTLQHQTTAGTTPTSAT